MGRPVRRRAALAAAAVAVLAFAPVAAAGAVSAAGEVPVAGGAPVAGASPVAAAGSGGRNGHAATRFGVAADALAGARHDRAVLPAGTVARAACPPPAAGRAGCLALTAARAGGRLLAMSAPDGYGPADLWSAYRLPAAAGGTGQTVAVVDAYDDPNAEADLAAYRAAYSLPACSVAGGCLRIVDQSGATSPRPAADAGWATEISLDLDVVSAICPNCHILLVEASSDRQSDLAAAVRTAVRLGATEVSASWGGTEQPGDAAACAAGYRYPGVPVLAATGDFGYGVDTPAACPGVVAVGGTSLYPAAGTARGWRERAWSFAGSGCSAVEQKPAWQRDRGCPGRTVADVAAVADLGTGVAVYDSYPSGGWLVAGGTSLATPLVAGAYALAGSPPPGAAAASLYGNAWALNDVVGGSTGTCPAARRYLCQAVVGYDGPTGLGTPNGLDAFVQPPAPHPGWSPALVPDGSGGLLLLDAGRDGVLELTSQPSGSTWRSSRGAGGVLTAGPGAAATAAGQAAVVARGSTGALWLRTVGTGAAATWTDLGGLVAGAPAVAASTPGRLDVFVTGTDHALWTRSETPGGGWSAWTSLGGRVAAGTGPAAVGTAAGELTVAVHGTDGRLYTRDDLEGSTWGPWTPLGGGVLGDPAVAAGGGRTDVFVEGGDHALWFRERAGVAWSAWQRLGGTLTAGPAAVTDPATGTTTVVVPGAAGRYWARARPGAAFGSFSPVP